MAISWEEMQAPGEPPAPIPVTKGTTAISWEEMASQRPYTPEPKTVGDKVGEYSLETAKGFATGGARLAKTAGLAMGGVARLADMAVSAYTGKESTKLQDEVFFNHVDPWVERMQRLEPEKGVGKQFAHTVGDLSYMIVESILSSPAAAVELTAAKGATLLAAPGMKTGMDLARAEALRGTGAMSIPAVQAAIDTGQSVLKETGDKVKAATAAVSQYISTIEIGILPISAQGGKLLRTATGVPLGVVQGETTRIAQNQAMPETMQSPFSWETVATNAFLGGSFALAFGQNPTQATAQLKKLADDNSDAFSEFVARDPGAAEKLATQVAEIDPMLAKYIKNNIKKFTDASEKELFELGEAAAKRRMTGMVPEEKDIKKLFTDVKTSPESKTAIAAAKKAEAQRIIAERKVKTAKTPADKKAAEVELKAKQQLEELVKKEIKPEEPIVPTKEQQAAKDLFSSKESITSKPGVNARRMAKMLGPQLYGDPTNMGVATIKEILQNSHDAIKTLLKSKSITSGKIDIKTDEASRSISIVDNGSGMASNILATKFLEIAGSGKETKDASGGFGIAKMLFLYGNKDLHVITMRDGKVSEMKTTGEQLFDALEDQTKAPKIDVREPTEADKKLFPQGHGTSIKLVIPENFKDPGTGSMKDIQMLRDADGPYGITPLVRSPLFAPIDVSYNGKPVHNVGSRFKAENYTHFVNVKFDWGNARLYVTKVPNDTWGENLHVLSNGLYQFSTKIVKNPGEMYGPSVPYTFYLDINPSVNPDEPGYPFTFNRKGFTEQAKAEYVKVANYINAIYAYKNLSDEAKSFGTVQYLEKKGGKVSLTKPHELIPTVPPKATNFDIIKEGDAVSVEGGRLLINGKEQPELSPEDLKAAVPESTELKVPKDQYDSNRVMLHDNTQVRNDNYDMVPLTEVMRDKFGPRFDEYLHTVGSRLLGLRKVVAEAMGWDKLLEEAVGISIDTEYRGVSTRVPFEGTFINPLIPEAKNITEASYGILGTMIHEFAHFNVRGHDEKFPAEMQKILYTLDARTSRGVFDFDKFRHKFTEELAQYADIIKEAQSIYESKHLEPRGKRFKDSNEGIRSAVGDDRVYQGDDGSLGAAGAGQRVREGTESGTRAAGAGRTAEPTGGSAEATQRLASEGLSDAVAELSQLKDTPRKSADTTTKQPQHHLAETTALQQEYENSWQNSLGTFMRLRREAISGQLFGGDKVTTSHMVLDDLLRNLPPGPIRDIADHLRRHTMAVEVLPINKEIVINGDRQGNSRGTFHDVDDGPGRIYIRTDNLEGTGAWNLEVFLHEVSHAGTARFIHENPNHPLTKRLNGLFEQARVLMPEVVKTLSATGELLGPTEKVDYSKMTGGATYGLRDMFEFVAEGRTGPQFARLLMEAGRLDSRGILSKLQGVFHETARTISKMLGFAPKEAKLYESLWDVTNRIMVEQRKNFELSMKKQEGTEPVIYHQAGVPVTREDVRFAFRAGMDLARKVPGAKVVEGKMAEYWNQILRTVAPEALGPEAKQAGAIAASHIARQAQHTSMVYGRAETRKAFWDKRTGDVTAFINGFEKGKKFADPELQQAADGYRAWNKQMFDTEQKLGLEYEAVDNYLYHVFKDNKGVQRFFEQKYGIKWGDPKFIKDRTFDLYEQAVEAGFEPAFTNPEDIMLARQHASDIARAKIEMLQELERYGLAQRYKKGEKIAPEGFSSTPKRSPNGQMFWVNERANVILHNLYDTKSLWQMKGIGGDTFRGMMFLKNASVPFILGLSGFHALHVQTIDNATWMVRATKELMSGTVNPAQWLSQMGQATFYRDIVSNPKQGSRLLHLTQGRIPDGEMTQADRMALQFMAEGGFIPEMSHQYRTGARQAFMKAVREKSLTAPLKFPLALMDTIQSVMFEKWIPALKAASYMKDVQTALTTDPSLMQDPLRRKETFRKLSKSVDNRYGEMNYNTLFWNRMVKDLGVASTLSLGWNLGFIREYGGAGVEAVQGVLKEGKVAAKGDYDRALFVTFYTLQSLMYGGLMTYLFTGQSPSELIDYVFPKNGEKNPDGTDQRVSTMFYAREFMAIAKHMEHEGVLPGLGKLAANKMAPSVGMVMDQWTNTNYFGAEISDPNAEVYTRVGQRLAYAFAGLEPISIGTMRESYSQKPFKTAAMAVAGFSPAPKYITESGTEAEIKGTFQKYFGSKQTPYEKAEYSMEAKKLKDLYNLNRPTEYREQLDMMREKYQLTTNELKNLRKNVRKGADPIVKMFSRLTWQQQKRILDKMTPEERKKYLPHSSREHLRGKYKAPKENSDE